ncbi:DUF2147 domain-containing protein [Algoriphagus jejuensis]|uniref:DUF2147 domain-containing protein n=1 Tax=Algoriphagus jejuensis TaxID=419934 RepID=A0ABN1MY13_9BACT
MKIRQFPSFFILFYLVLGLSASAQSENAIVGVWLDTDKTAKIEIYRSDKEFEGKIIWMQNPNTNGSPTLDAKNPEHKLKTRPIVGLTILDGLQYKDGVWKEGDIYDPKSGKTYSCELKLQTNDVLEVKGYIGFSFVGKTVKWTRVR